jgi:aldehyde dehydrogenase (NAD+)
MWEYLKPAWESDLPDAAVGEEETAAKPPAPPAAATSGTMGDDLPAVDRTYKLFIGGKQVRPDQGYTRPIRGPSGRPIGEVGEGNRKDLRNAVEAAHAAAAWGRRSGHHRAQVLYYVAENLSVRAEELAHRIDEMTGAGVANGRREVETAVARLFTYASWADKYDGAVHHVPIRGVTLAMNEPIGVMGIAAPESFPLLGFVSLVAPAVATGNTVIVIPSERHPLSALDCYSVFETSDLPDGVVNIVTGAKEALAKILAEHHDVEGLWFFGSPGGAKVVEQASAANMKRTWVVTKERDWFDRCQGEGREFLRQATQVKNIWIPYGE